MTTASTREHLLDTASTAILHEGVDALSMDLVRSRAGVSNGSLYHHFASKAHLVDALYAQALREFHATLVVPIAGRASARTAVRSMVRAYLDWVLEHPDRARLLHSLRRTEELAQAPGEWKQVRDEGFGRLRVWVEGKIAEGEMRDLPFDIWVALVFAPVISLTGGWLRAKEPVVPAKHRTLLADAAWNAVRPEGSPDGA